jgi:hypothetical protein
MTGRVRIVTGLAMFAVLAAVPVLPVVPASAADVTISISINEVVFGDEGDVFEVASVAVDPDSVGARCLAGSVEVAEGSTHPNNDYIVSSAGTSAVIADFEAAGGAVVPMAGAITLGESIEVELRLGPDGVSSGGFVITLTCTPPGRGRFVDDDSSIFEDDIEWLAAQGITLGCNPPLNDRFCPDDTVTRGQMAAFLVRTLHLTDRLDNPFPDDDDSIFEADIEKLAAAGITRGCNPPANDLYCPDASVSREQMAAFMVRAFSFSDPGAGDLFVDDDDSIFEDDIDRLGTAGVTKGCNPPTNDRYCPDSVVTRGQMAAFLHRAVIAAGQG